MTRVDGFQTFLLRAMCMWNIHDYPSYGLFVGCHVKGLHGMPFMWSKRGHMTFLQLEEEHVP